MLPTLATESLIIVAHGVCVVCVRVCVVCTCVCVCACVCVCVVCTCVCASVCVCVCVCVCECLHVSVCQVPVMLPPHVELGHSFGSNHDPSTGGPCDPPRGRRAGQGKYLMHMAAVDGTEPNNLVGGVRKTVTEVLLLPW